MFGFLRRLFRRPQRDVDEVEEGWAHRRKPNTAQEIARLARRANEVQSMRDDIERRYWIDSNKDREELLKDALLER